MISYILSLFLSMLFSFGNTVQCMHQGPNTENVEMNLLATDFHYLTLANEQRLQLLRQSFIHNSVDFDLTERCILLVSDTKDDVNKTLHFQASCLAVKALKTQFATRNAGLVPALFPIHCAYLKGLINTAHVLPNELKDLPVLVSELNLLLAQARVANNPDDNNVSRRKLFH